MKRGIFYYQAAGIIFTSILGTLLHFVFDWFGQRPFWALFSAVNESIWEHIKLLFYPMLLFAWAQYFFWGRPQNFWCVKLRGILLGLVLIPVLYYTYTGILGVNADWFNITIFFLSAIASYTLEYKLFTANFSCKTASWVAIFCLALIAAAFTIFTFLPPHIPFFQDPSGTFGY